MTTKGIDLAPPNIDMIQGISTAGAVAGNVLVFDSNLDLVPGAGGGGGSDHMAVTVSNENNAAVTLSVTSNQVMSGTFVPSNAGITHSNLVASNNNDNTNYVHLTLEEKTKITSLNDQIRGPTGFLAQDSIDLSYDSNTLSLTLNTTAGAVFKGATIPSLVNGWVSSAHPTNNGTYYKSFDGTNYVWSTNFFGTFDNVQIAAVYKDAAVSFGLVECHGAAMDPDGHRNQHFGVGTQKLSGGALTQVVVNSYTAADRRPYVEQTYVLDEDKSTLLPALSTNSYTQVWLTGTISAGTNEGTLNWATASADIVNLTTTRPNVNILTSGTGVLTPVSAGQFMSVWLLAVPVTTDANSQKFRYVWVQGQTQTPTAAAQTSIDSRTLETRKLSRAIPESVFIQQVVLEYVGGGTTNWRINTVKPILGSRVNQITVSGYAGISSVTSDSNYFSGLGTPASQLTLTTNVATIGATNTFTAKQTFDGGAAIKGIATAPATGYIGEKVTAAVSQTTISSSNTAVTLANGLVLEAGTWRIFYSCSADFTTGASSEARGQVQVWIYENSASSIATVLGTSKRSLYCKTVNAVSNTIIAPLVAEEIVTISAQKDYRLGGIRLDGAGTNTATIYADSTFYAVRIG
jgi:hypothetical protein